MISVRRLLSSAAISITVVVVSLSAPAGDLKYTLVTQEVLMDRLKDAPWKNADRARELQKMFEQVGCETTDEPVKGLHEPNVLCMLRGVSDAIIVVGGHLD